MHKFSLQGTGKKTYVSCFLLAILAKSKAMAEKVEKLSKAEKTFKDRLGLEIRKTTGKTT